MQCFQDCCLFCDRDSPDGAYCSQQCKLADHERSSQPTTPTTLASGQWSSSQHYHQASSDSSSQYQQQYYYQSSQQQSSSSDRQLTPSSSRSSLSSNMSSSLNSMGGLSAQAKQDLAGYFNSFDQARAAKRRSSTR